LRKLPADSPSFVREPDGHGVAERFIRTLIENLLRVRHFATAAERAVALQELRRRDNGEWLIERLGFRTPGQARRDLAAAGCGAGPTCRRVGCRVDRRRCEFAFAPELVAGSTMPAARPETSSNAAFPTTRWSQVVAAGDRAGPAARDALAELCSAYWYPLYAFVRRKGHPPDEAADLVQGTFLTLLDRDGLAAVAPERGRFRSFLMAACSHPPGRLPRPRPGRQAGRRRHADLDRSRPRRRPLLGRAGR
jgi:hypothetical protein